MMRCAALLTALPLAAAAAEPVLTHVHPAGLQRGTTVPAELIGTFNPWPVRLVADVPGITFTAGKDAGTGEITVAPEVPPGAHLVRAVNAEGASVPVALMIAAAPQTAETEPNDDPAAPQQLEGSVGTVNGRLGKRGDIDGFRLRLSRGQQLVARTECFLLAAPVDLMLRITDAAGTVLAFNHDHVTMDPALVFTAPADGDYGVQVMGHKYPASTELEFTGGRECVYRLHLSTAPEIRNCWPLAVTRGQAAAVMLEGWNLTDPFREVAADVAPGLPVLLSDVPQSIAAADPQPLALPGGCSGRLESPGDEDRFTFQVAAGASLQLRVAASSLGSSMDPVLRMTAADGKELASDDDGGGFGEALLNWTAPAEGSYTAVITDRAQRGGSGFYYHFEAATPRPALTAIVAVHQARVEAGKSVELKVKLARSGGFGAALRLTAEDLPPGITGPPVEVPADAAEVTFSLTGAADAPAASQPFRLVLREGESGPVHPVKYVLTSGGEDNGVPNGFPRLLVADTSWLWLTVIPPPPAAPPVPPAEPPPAKP